MDERRRRAWQALELGPRWQSRQAISQAVSQSAAEAGMQAAPEALPSVPDAAVRPRVDAPGSMQQVRTWTILQEGVESCAACELSATRSHVVFGSGPQSAAWMLVGEAPGEQEDAQGLPFVGPAGQLLDQMLASIGVDRPREVFITNVLKCRPPGNRDPHPPEVAQCEPFLREQIESVQPRLILALGRFAAQTLLGSDASLSSMRGRVHAYRSGQRDIPLVVTYHPAYLLRSQTEKRRAWEDLKLARRTLSQSTGN